VFILSKPVSAARLRTYHAEEFANARNNYFATGETVRGHWYGQLAHQWGLIGDVQEEAFARLAEGRHPLTGDVLVHHQTARAYLNTRGEMVTTVAHRAGWDATNSAPKSVSLTALVGGDDRVREAHRVSVAVALDETERFVQARLRGNQPLETTGKWIAAAFEHDSSRPVDGYAAPHLHTHVVVFNMTEVSTGQTRALQPLELYRSQSYATAVYRSELATRLRALGYAIERGAYGQPEVHGYTPAYLAASSPRSRQIEAHLAEVQRSGAGAAEIAAHRTREAKLDLSHDEMQRRHRELAHAFGDQPTQVVQAAHARVHQIEPHEPATAAREAVTFAKARNFEREAVADERVLVRDALRRSMGEVPVEAIHREFERRVDTAEFVSVTPPPGVPSRTFTTREMMALERETIELMRAGQLTEPALVGGGTRHEIERAHRHLSDPHRAAVDQILTSHDRVIALDGVAGAGKTNALTAIRDAATREGYRVEGLAPTSRAAYQLTEGGIPSQTLRRHLGQQSEAPAPHRRLYIVAESSLASTRQMHEFLHRLRADDRVLVVGDTRQQRAVEAGRPYHQLRDAGIETVRLEDIVRQQDPGLQQAVRHLSRGDIHAAMHHLDHQGRIHEIIDRENRLTAIADAYTRHHDGTLVVAPDHQSRRAINQRIHARLLASGQIDRSEHRARVLVARQDVTSADRQWARHYAPGDVVRYSVGSRTVGLRAGEYTRIEYAKIPANLVTVVRATGERVTYDPRRLRGVTLFRETERAFARGDRVQFTARYQEQRVANQERGTIERIEAKGRVRVRLESGRRVAFSLERYPHLDYGYAVTTHRSHGQLADRVLVHLETAGLGEPLVNRRLAYVAVSRGRYDAQVYTDDKARLAEALSRDVSHRRAIKLSHPPGRRASEHDAAHRSVRDRSQTLTFTL
jgi:conjugative relaxase-like TrwC/TraI family protein